MVAAAAETEEETAPAAKRLRGEATTAISRSKDARGWRAKIAVLVPSTNTVVQPDFEDFRAALGKGSGVTNHVGRITIPNMDISDDAKFEELQRLIPPEVDAAADRVMTAACDHVAMGMSAPTFFHGYQRCVEKREALSARCGGVGVSSGSFACEAVLKKFGCKRISVLSPYAAVGDVEVTRFFLEAGFEVLRFRGLRCATPIAIAEVAEEELERHLREINGPDVDALVQVGTNLSCVAVAARLEREFGKPVVAINAATYWQALRSLGIDDKISGFGRLFEEL